MFVCVWVCRCMHQTNENRHLRWSSKTSNSFEMCSGMNVKPGKCLHVQKLCVENNVNGSVMVGALQPYNFISFWSYKYFNGFQHGKFTKVIFHSIGKHKTDIILKCACMCYNLTKKKRKHFIAQFIQFEIYMSWF